MTIYRLPAEPIFPPINQAGPDGLLAVRSLEEGIELARTQATSYLEDLLQCAGAAEVEVRVARKDCITPVRGQPGVALIEIELVFTAVGRPITGHQPAAHPGAS